MGRFSKKRGYPPNSFFFLLRLPLSGKYQTRGYKPRIPCPKPRLRWIHIGGDETPTDKWMTSGHVRRILGMTPWTLKRHEGKSGSL